MLCCLTLTLLHLGLHIITTMSVSKARSSSGASWRFKKNVLWIGWRNELVMQHLRDSLFGHWCCRHSRCSRFSCTWSSNCWHRYVFTFHLSSAGTLDNFIPSVCHCCTKAISYEASRINEVRVKHHHPSLILAVLWIYPHSAGSMTDETVNYRVSCRYMTDTHKTFSSLTVTISI